MSLSFWCGMLAGAALLLVLSPAPPPAAFRVRTRRRPGWRLDRLARCRSVRRQGAVDIGAVMTEVAARLRMGASIPDAWSRTLVRADLPWGLQVPGPDGSHPDFLDCCPGLDLAEEIGAALSSRPGESASGRSRHGLPAEVAGVTAAVRLAERLGSPLADVLDRCAAGVVAAGRAESARRVALAGPTSTARLLTGLPLVGLLLGVVLGADPVAALTDGGVGTAAGAAGLGLLLLGRRWAMLLVSRARAAGGPETAP